MSSCSPPQYLQLDVNFVSRLALFTFLLVGLAFRSALISSPCGCFRLFIRWDVVSALRQMSIVRWSVSFVSWRSFFLAQLSAMPRTKRSRSRESCTQLQNPHVCAKVRKAVMYWSTVSPSFCWRLLKLKRSYVSLVSPMQNSANFVITASRSLLFVSGSKYIPSYMLLRRSPKGTSPS